MRYETHLTTGFLAGTIVNKITEPAGRIITGLGNINTGTILVVGLGMLGAVLPDLDLPQSKISGQLSPGNKFISKLVLKLIIFLLIGSAATLYYLKHIYGSLALIVVAVILVINFKAIYFRILMIIRVLTQISIIAAVLIDYYMYGRLSCLFLGIALVLYLISSHRGISHALPLCIFTSCTLFFSLKHIVPLKLASVSSLSFFIGQAVHIYLNDYFTDGGIPFPLYPLNNLFNFKGEGKKKPERYKFKKTIKTGSRWEHVIIAVLLPLAFLLYVV